MVRLRNMQKHREAMLRRSAGTPIRDTLMKRSWVLVANASKAPRQAVGKDLTGIGGTELTRRIDEALILSN